MFHMKPGYAGYKPQYEFYELHATGAGLEATFGGYAAFTYEHKGGVDVVDYNYHLENLLAHK